MPAFTNQATLTYNGQTTNSNVVTGEILENLSMTKTPVGAVYGPDDTVTYAISILNAGVTSFTGLTLTDNLGSYVPAGGADAVTPLTYLPGTVRYYVNGVLQAVPAVTDDPTLTITGINVPAGGNALILYSARTNGFAPLGPGAALNNTATLTGPGVLTPVTADAAITPDQAPRLSITKALSPTQVSENGQLTYTLTVENYGPTAVTATDNASITDAFDPILSNLAVTYNGAPWTAGVHYTYNAATGLFTTVPGQLSVPAATYTQDPTTGVITTTPGVATVTITGTV